MLFAPTGLEDDPPAVNLNCESELAELWRGRYAAVTPGYHMNKRHPITVRLDGSISDSTLRECIDLSYELVVGGLSRAEREALDRPGRT